MRYSLKTIIVEGASLVGKPKKSQRQQKGSKEKRQSRVSMELDMSRASPKEFVEGDECSVQS